MSTVTEAEAIAELERIATQHAGDAEVAHYAVDQVLLALVSPAIREARDRVVEVTDGWYYA